MIFYHRFGLRIGFFAKNESVFCGFYGSTGIFVKFFSKKYFGIKCRISGIFSFFYFFCKLFLKKRLTF